MKQIVKKTPITFNGVDGWEVLILDTGAKWEDGSLCDRCMYKDWDNVEETMASCDIVHHCTIDFPAYFKFEK